MVEKDKQRSFADKIRVKKLRVVDLKRTAGFEWMGSFKNPQNGSHLREACVLEPTKLYSKNSKHTSTMNTPSVC